MGEAAKGAAEITMSLHLFLVPLAAYILGSIPFGLVMGRLKGIDPRQHGSGNIGATNVARTVGKTYGLLTLLLDISKGLLPVAAASWLYPGQSFLIALTGLAAMLGHCFSIFLGLKGGKGVATALGVALGVCPASFLVCVAVFFAVFKIWRYVSVGSLSAMAVMAPAIHFLCPDTFFESMAWTICFVVWLKHSDNLRRLARGEEKRFSSKGRDS